MVRIHPDPPLTSRMVASQSRRAGFACTRNTYTRVRAPKNGEARGAVAQLGEHLLCKQGVVGSIPSSSTIELGIGPPGLASQRHRIQKQAARVFRPAVCFWFRLKPVVIGCSLTIRKK